MPRSATYKTDISIFLLLAIILLIGGGILFTLNVLRSDPIEESLSSEEVLNILFVLEGKGAPLGSYVMMYSPMNNKASTISIPGDIGRILKTVDRVDRIDSVYRSGNISAYKTEVEDLLGLTITYSIIFETEKLSKTIDAIEGIELFIPNAIEVYEPEFVLFPSGTTKLDGDKGIQYLLLELPDEDRNNITLRRERFFLGLLKSLGESRTGIKHPAIARYVYPLIKSGMNQLARKRLFESLYDLDIDRISIQTVAGNYREVSGKRLLRPYYEGTVIKDVVRQAQRSLAQKTQGTLMERIYTVEILNGTGITGLAGKTADLIRGYNYDVISINNADRTDYETTEIISRTGIESVGNDFAAIIRCKKIRNESRMAEDDASVTLPTNEYRADLTLIIGKDFDGRFVTGN
jgi:anionic cell wall polymer biosynthesis LytR-Cps2A-Psr (LCP) family protein